MAKRFWPDQDPIGKRVKFGPITSTSPWQSIIGVVGEVKYRGLPENPTLDPDIYLPFTDRSQQVAIAVRTGVPPNVIAPSIRAAIRAADPSIPVYNVAPMEELIEGLHIGHVFCLLHVGNMPDEKTRHSSKLFAERVMPKLRGLWPEWKDDSRWWIKPMPNRLQPERSLPGAEVAR